MKYINPAILLMVLFFVNSSFSAPVYRIESFSFSIFHPVPERALKEIRKRANSLKGYTLYLTNNQVKISVPISSKEKMLESLRKTGYVNDEQVYASDVTKSVITLETQLQGKKKFINQLYAIFKDSSLSETLEMEQELNKAILEAERIEGQLNRYKNSSKRVVINISVTADATKTRLRKPNQSQFNWINNLGIQNLYNR